MPGKKSEWIGILLLTAGLFGGMMFFKETLYFLTLTILLIMIMVVYVLFNSRRKNSFKKPGEKPEQKNKASPSENVDEKE
ncbi:MAG: hypothetical protein FGF50_09295 [Candidatus Brockarchaeota archaeon]|nr:hypothetical protein [Candidatus Brockarchaeota archaeon]